MIEDDDMEGIVEAVHDEEPPPLPPPPLEPPLFFEPPESLPMALRVDSRWLCAVDSALSDLPALWTMVCSCVSFRVFASSDVCMELWVDEDMDIPFEGSPSSSSDWSSLAIIRVEDAVLSAPPAPDRSPGVIYPSDETVEEPRAVVPIRKEQVSPVL